MRLTVVGGGVIGLACAVACERAGAEVTVVDSGTCGGLASRGNAGWIVPSLSAPRTGPGAVAHVARAAIGTNAGGPTVHALADRAAGTWLWRGWRNSTPARHRAGTAAMIALSRDAVDDFDDLRAAGVDFEIHAQGLLLVGRRKASIERFVDGLQQLNALGYHGAAQLLDGEGARSLEPALSDGVQAGLLLSDEQHVRPESFTRGLVDYLVRAGADVHEHTHVKAIRRARTGEWVVTTVAGDLASDQVLVAAGVGSRALLAACGTPLVMMGAGGTSITARGRGSRPGRPLKLAETMVACSPFDNAMRLSGGYRIGLSDDRVAKRHVRRVLRGAAPYLRDWQPTDARIEWAGTRPITPDDLPIIGPVPGRPGLYVATGHGTLGVTLAPTTARLLAESIVEGVSSRVLGPFRADRPALAMLRGRQTRRGRRSQVA